MSTLKKALGINLFAVGAMAAVMASPAQAALVTFDVTGTISSITDPLAAFGGVGAGTTFAGSYTFESTTPDASPADPSDGRYVGALTAFSLTIGSHVLVYDGASPNQIRVRNDASCGPSLCDSYSVLADFAGTGGYSDIDLNLGGGGPGSMFASDALPLSSAFFGDLTSKLFTLQLFEGTGPGKAQTGTLSGRLTGLVERQVPTPGTLALLGLGFAGFAWSRSRKDR